MSPLAPAGTRGYTDGQRIQNWDSGLLFEEAGANHPGAFVPPLQDVSRWAYLGGLDQIISGPVRLQLEWVSDAAASVAIGSRTITLHELIPNPAQYRLPNLGPYVQLSYTPVPLGAWQHTCALIGTNRVHPLEFVPTSSVLIDRQNVALAAGVTTTLYPSDYYAGPVTVWYNAGGASGLVWAEALNPGGVWDQIAQFAPAAAGNNALTWTMPPGAWRFNVKNTTAGAVGYFLAVTPSTTGAN